MLQALVVECSRVSVTLSYPVQVHTMNMMMMVITRVGMQPDRWGCGVPMVGILPRLISVVGVLM